MSQKKLINLSGVSFNDLKEKAKDIDGAQSMNRFELTQAVLKAENKPAAAGLEQYNPRSVKSEILALKAKLAGVPKSDKNARQELRKTLTNLKRDTRRYL